MYSGDDESGRSDVAPDAWLPFGQDEDLWHDEAAYVMTKPERVRRRGMIAGIVFLGLAIAGGGGAFGADAYATQAICAAVGRTGPARTPDGAAKNAEVALDKARQTLDDTAALLFFHPELREATRNLAHDLADMQQLQDTDALAGATPGGTGGLLVVAMSVDTHARQAQTACGLPAQGVLNAAAPRMSTSATPAPSTAIDVSPPAAVHASPPTHRAAHPWHSSVRSTPAPPSPAPALTATAADLRAAERMVAVTARKDQLASVSPTASDAERQVTSYEHAAAVQRLTDLRAGHPDVRHHALDVRGARARLAAAEEDYRRTMIDPTVSPFVRSQARAVVEQWNETLTSLEN